MKHQRFLSATLLLLTWAGLQTSSAKITLPTVFSNNMVFQQKTKATIWGQATPGKTVTVNPAWSKQQYTTKADAQGNWQIKMTTPAYGGPYTLTISDGTPLQLSNVMVGEVWICSGQSNMEMPVAGWGKINDYEQELAAANYPGIRLLQVDHTISNTPKDDVHVSGQEWKPCTPQNVAEFSAVAYTFARELYKKTGIPIGLIHTSWGGTIIEAWTGATALSKVPGFTEQVNNISKTRDNDESQERKLWQQILDKNDAGNGKTSWITAALDDSDWKTMAIPGYWEQSALPDFNGVVYFRKTINLPASWAGQSIRLNLGTIDDDDITYFNGEKIGETTGVSVSRTYTIPAAMVKAGNNVITVRVFDGQGEGGFYGQKGILSLTSASGERISLDGDWKFRVGINLKDLPSMPAPASSPNRPTVLFNAMINPFTRFAIRGAIWYQGESNADRAAQYRNLFPAMINNWRSAWQQGDFPFYFVQLANFRAAQPEPVPSTWAALRDAQREVLTLKNTGMAVITDIGNADDIHPKNKQEVGRRLALIALDKTYGQATPYSGPSYTSMKVEGAQVRLNFNFTTGGLKPAAGNSLTGFAIAGTDQKFHWAKAVVQGNQVILSCPEVPNPVAVRYAWADNPNGNLTNGSGLPASPFRTDQWELL